MGGLGGIVRFLCYIVLITAKTPLLVKIGKGKCMQEKNKLVSVLKQGLSVDKCIEKCISLEWCLGFNYEKEGSGGCYLISISNKDAKEFEQVEYLDGYTRVGPANMNDEGWCRKDCVIDERAEAPKTHCYTKAEDFITLVINYKHLDDSNLYAACQALVDKLGGILIVCSKKDTNITAVFINLKKDQMEETKLKEIDGSQDHYEILKSEIKDNTDLELIKGEQLKNRPTFERKVATMKPASNESFFELSVLRAICLLGVLCGILLVHSKLPSYMSKWQESSRCLLDEEL